MKVIADNSNLNNKNITTKYPNDNIGTKYSKRSII